MILGDYPCCGGDLCLAMPDQTPSYAKEVCPHCGVEVWHEFSRIQPRSFTVEQFDAEFEVDDATMQVKRRYQAPELPQEVVDELMAAWADVLLNGTGAISISFDGLVKRVPPEDMR